MSNILTSTEFILGIILLPILYWLWAKGQNKRLNGIPGPIQWPLVGNTVQLGSRPYLAFVKWTRKYGDIYKINMIGHETVVISDEKLIRQAFNNPDLTGRPTFGLFEMLHEGPHGLINSQKEEWIEQRRFTLRHLRDFGFGKRGMEDLIQTEVGDLLVHLKNLEGQPIVSMKEKFSLAVVNALWMMVSGHRYELDDPELLQLYKKMTRFNEEMSFAIFFPKFAKLFPSLSGLNRLLDFIHDLRSFIVRTIDDHVTNPAQDDEPRDFIDVYLKEIKNTTDPASSFYKENGKRSMISTVIDLYFAGLETTSTSLNWAILYMAKYPAVQQKLQTELDNVLGGNRRPTLGDRSNLVWCEAAVLELFRKSSIVSASLVHVALADMKIGDYDIPKGTWVTGNFYYVHHDPKLWKDPDNFDPSRFLIEEMDDGKKTLKVQKSSSMLAFSVGKRVCMGEIMARDSIFLFLTSILQKFHIEFAQDSKNVSLEPKPGMAMNPQPFKIIMRERNSK